VWAEPAAERWCNFEGILKEFSLFGHWC